MLLPPLRQDLQLHPGPANTDGSPTWLIYDPQRARYFQIGWVLFEIIRRWEEGDAVRLASRVNEQTTLHLSAEDVQDVVKFLNGHELLRAFSEAHTKQLLARHKGQRQSVLKKLIHNYLFFRIPLFKPDRFLTVTLPYVRVFGKRAFAIATFMALVLGLVLAIRQWSAVVAEFRSTMSLNGLIGYIVAVIFAKIVHELGHAFVAKSYGCRVATMGVAFLVLYPVPYTDTNDAWKVKSRTGRLAIASAGLAAEFYLAAWATLLWSFLPEGPLKTASFTLAVTTWVMSLAVNVSPIMRFDGYYILSDLWDMPNLHARAFALGRWRLREALFGLGEPAPELMPLGRRNLVISFAYAVWFLRLVVFIGIALLVYHFFIKLVGIVLFVIEVVWFILLPLFSELGEWWRRRSVVLRRARSWLTFLLFLSLVLVISIPWYGRVEAPALLRAERVYLLFPVADAEIASLHMSEGAHKKAGEPLIALRSSVIDYQIQDNDVRRQLLEKQLKMTAFDEALRGQSQFLREKLSSSETERASLLEQKARLQMTAPFDGTVFALDQDLRVEQAVSHKQKLASLKGGHGSVAIGYVNEAQLDRVKAGQTAVFYPDAIDRAPINMLLSTVERDTVKSIEHAVLASKFGGPVHIVESGQALQPAAALYKVVATTVGDASIPEIELRGRLQISGHPESFLSMATRTALGVLVRESGF